MKTIEIKLYTYDELSVESKKNALVAYNETNEDPMLQAHLQNLLKEELDNRKIKYDTDSIRVMYSLSHSQGDGLMFEGNLTWQGLEATIKQSGRYYHEYSKSIDMPEASEREYEDLERVYVAICKKIAQAGYDEIAYQESEEAFQEACEANEWTFEQNGKLRTV